MKVQLLKFRNAKFHFCCLNSEVGVYTQGDSNKVLQQVFSFIIGDNFFLLFTNKTTFIELFNRDDFFPKGVLCPM